MSDWAVTQSPFEHGHAIGFVHTPTAPEPLMWGVLLLDVGLAVQNHPDFLSWNSMRRVCHLLAGHRRVDVLIVIRRPFCV